MLLNLKMEKKTHLQSCILQFFFLHLQTTINNISNIQFNMDDTITNPNYYSNCAASPYGLNDPTKYGRNFSGAFYKVKKMR